MKVAIERLAAQLEAELGREAVETLPNILACYTVDGKSPSILCVPRDAEQVGAALRVCAEVEASAIPWGGGTAVRLGNIPRRVDVVIALERLDRLIEHDDVNLTATVQAGMKVATLQKILRQRNQSLAIDPPFPELATIGGIVAANTNGARRMLYGGVRDLVIGMKMALASGQRIKAGGKVVKNVAGYDMCKLFIGSLGTLGIITEVTFKMAPIPESAATLAAWGSLAQGLELVQELSRTALLPASITLLSADVAKATGITGVAAVAVWIEGFEEAVNRHLQDLRALAGRVGMNCEILGAQAHQRLWEQVRDFGANRKEVVYQVTVPIASSADVAARIDHWSRFERPMRYVVHAGSGTVWISLDADASSGAWFPKLISLAEEHRGHAVMAAAPPELKDGVDVWGPPPPSLAIMREIKLKFDPQGILSPGRFIARL